MPTKYIRVVCLANSRKLSGRCVAGRLSTGKQIGTRIRPVSDRPVEEISEHERHYQDGSDPKVLDLIDIPFLARRPKPYQPENRLIDPDAYWKKVGTLQIPESAISMIYTIGHSNHPIERFVALLLRHKVTAVADVRSSPYSRFNPQFNRESLKKSLAENGIKYVFLGEELGARSKDRSCYEQGRVSYAKLAATDLFQQGLERLQTGMAQHKIAMMCAEKDPLDCHRTILVSRELVNRNIPVEHISESGSVESHDEALARLRRQLKIPEHDMFAVTTN